jgi:hypothetical protein
VNDAGNTEASCFIPKAVDVDGNQASRFSLLNNVSME